MILASSCKPFENFLYDIYSDKKAAEAGDKKEETKTDTKEEKKEEKKEESKEEDRSIELLISFTVYIYLFRHHKDSLAWYCILQICIIIITWFPLTSTSSSNVLRIVNECKLHP